MSLPSALRLGELRPLSLGLPRLHSRDLGLAAVALILITRAFWRPTDPDYWWHLKTGELILKDGWIPHGDIFSYTVTGKAWIDHEWLAQVIIYALQSTFGYAGATLFFVGVGLAATFVGYRLLRRLSVTEPASLLLVSWGALLSHPFWAVRPAGFSLLFTAIFLAAAFEYRRGLRRHLWLLPLLIVLWANLHGGYIFGIGLLVLLAAVELFEALRGQGSRERAGHVALVAGLAFLAAGVNPYTYELWLYPFTYFVGDNASLSVIAEWQSPAFFHSFGTYPLALAVLALVGLGVAGRKLDAWRLCLGVLFTALALQSIRHQGLFALAFLPVAGEALMEASPRLAALRRPRLSPRLARMNAGILAAGIAFCVYAVASYGLQTGSEARTDLGSLVYPRAGAAFVREHYPEARLFNQYVWGGYLIETLYPDQPVFIDGRADVYGSDFLEDYVHVTSLGPGWEALLDEHAVDLVLMPPASTLAGALRVHDGWREVMTGRIEAVFVREELAGTSR